MLIVTGGAGFIGSNLVHSLNAAGHTDIVVVDDLTDGTKIANLSGARFSDYLDMSELLAELPRMPKPRAIFHQGALSSTTEMNGRLIMECNYRFSKQLLDIACEGTVPFFYASSAAVYGNGSAGFHEEADERPLNPYAFSKWAFDNLVRERLQRTQAQIVGLRYFNVYGPNENHKRSMASLVSQLYKQLRAGLEATLFEGSAEFRRDFVHVSDVARLNIELLDSKTRGIYNCGTGRSRSFLELAQLLVQAHGAGTLKFVPFPETLRRTYQRSTCADMRKLRATGRGNDMLDLETGVARYHELLMSNDGYRLLPIRTRNNGDT